MPQRFHVDRPIRFQHCDPAGIVYYPRFFTLLHETMEDFLAHIGHGEPQMIAAGRGVPIVQLATDFLGMSRHGETVRIELGVWKLGGASIGFAYRLHGPDGALRLRCTSTVVHVDLRAGRPLPLPPDLRAALQPYVDTSLAPPAAQ
jgi:4-hydroxybenzoyl-CoA thioesterase